MCYERAKPSPSEPHSQPQPTHIFLVFMFFHCILRLYRGPGLHPLLFFCGCRWSDSYYHFIEAPACTPREDAPACVNHSSWRRWTEPGERRWSDSFIHFLCFGALFYLIFPTSKTTLPNIPEPSQGHTRDCWIVHGMHNEHTCSGLTRPCGDILGTA